MLMGKAMVIYSYTAKIHFFNELGFIGLPCFSRKGYSTLVYSDISVFYYNYNEIPFFSKIGKSESGLFEMIFIYFIGKSRCLPKCSLNSAIEENAIG